MLQRLNRPTISSAELKAIVLLQPSFTYCCSVVSPAYSTLHPWQWQSRPGLYTAAFTVPSQQGPECTESVKNSCRRKLQSIKSGFQSASGQLVPKSKPIPGRDPNLEKKFTRRWVELAWDDLGTLRPWVTVTIDSDRLHSDILLYEHSKDRNAQELSKIAGDANCGVWVPVNSATLT